MNEKKEKGMGRWGVLGGKEFWLTGLGTNSA